MRIQIRPRALHIWILCNAVKSRGSRSTYLSLCGLVPDEGMLEQLVRVGPLVVVLHQRGLDKVLELGRPLPGL